MPTEPAHSIDLNLPEKLQNREYRQKFFLAETSARIAAQLIALRKRRGLNQQQLAELLDTKQPAISRIEKADYQSWSFSILRKIAEKCDARIRVFIEPSEDVLGEYEAEKESVETIEDSNVQVGAQWAALIYDPASLTNQQSLSTETTIQLPSLSHWERAAQPVVQGARKLSVPTRFLRNWIQSHYDEQVNKAWERLAPRAIEADEDKKLIANLTIENKRLRAELEARKVMGGFDWKDGLLGVAVDASKPQQGF